jgi:hypothetical protein
MVITSFVCLCYEWKAIAIRVGVTLAIDDRFEVWDSGYISIPYDFQAGNSIVT